MSDRGDRSLVSNRNIVVGCHSSVWRGLSWRIVSASGDWRPIGHRDVGGFDFTSSDCVWVLSFSRDPAENTALLAGLAHANVREIVYVTSASTIVRSVTTCYEYPRVKRRAEVEALSLPNAKVLTIGLMYDNPLMLPGGESVATAYAELAAFFLSPDWSDGGGRQRHLFRRVNRPFGSAAEGWAHRQYGRLLELCGGRPCLLRPLDVFLRAVGVRWYGYVYLSNKLWISTTS